MTSHRSSLAALLIGTAAIAAGCGSSGGHTTKAGSTVAKTTTVRLAMPDIGDEQGQYFAKAVERLSHGQLKVSLDDAFDNTDSANEARLAPDLTKGAAQAGFMPARDWAMDGLPAFQALAAPFAVTTQTAMDTVATSRFARDALASLKRQHVVGLGLVPVEPRSLLSRRPLVDAADFRGAALRVVLDPAVDDALSALGATPTDVRRSPDVRTLLRSGKLTGAETSPQYALSNGYTEAAPYLTGYGLFAKFQVIGVNDRVWSGLDSAQQDALRKAAAETVTRAAQSDQLDRELVSVCRAGAVIVQPSAAQVAAIAKAGAVDTSGFADAARTLAAIPGTGAQPSAFAVPDGCKVASSTAAATAARASFAPDTAGTLPKSETASIPEGTYVTVDTVKDFHDGGQFGGDWDQDITWTFQIKDGQWSETQKPDFPDQGPCHGPLRIKGDVANFEYSPAADDACSGSAPDVLKWSYFKGQVHFTLVNVADTASKVIYAAHPWRKVD